MGDYSGWQLAFDIVQFLVLGAIGIYVYIGNKNRVSHTRITALEEKVDERIDDHETRISKAEENIRHLPIKDNISELNGKVERIGGDVRAVKAEVGGIRDLIAANTRTMELVHQFLLSHHK